MSKWSAIPVQPLDERWDVEPKSSLRRRERTDPLRAYACRMDAEAEAVLRKNPWLEPLLYEACGRLREIFGDEPLLDLERFDDPESPESAPTLFLVVRTQRAPHEADKMLDRFDETWWLDNLDRARGKLEFTIKRK